MKYSLGLFLLLIFSQAIAGTSQLILRGRVPASYIVGQDKNHRPVVSSNNPHGHYQLPNVKIFKGKKFYKITIVQP